MGDVEVRALHDVDIELFSGELLVLLGASGSGKSTLLNILGGLDVPTIGTVRYRDQDLTAASEQERTRYRREHVGFVFQFYNLIPSLTARENVALVTDIARAPMRPAEALAMVDLSDRLDHFPAQMSGGEQQRVAIARAIAKRPDVLLCDEPTGALDYETGKVVLSVLERINREVGTTTSLGAGYRLEARIVIWTDENVVRVPTSALFQQDDTWALFLVQAERATRRPVRIGHRSSDAAEILEGVEEGDRVILYPSAVVDDGVLVK